MDVVAELERRYLGRLHAEAVVLRREFPSVDIRVHSIAVGDKTDLQGHDLYLDCIIPGVSLDQPDNVALGVGLRHVTSRPEVDLADVCWGHPRAYVEAALDVRGRPFDDTTAALIEARLPTLLAALAAALARGHPPDV